MKLALASQVTQAWLIPLLCILGHAGVAHSVTLHPRSSRRGSFRYPASSVTQAWHILLHVLCILGHPAVVLTMIAAKQTVMNEAYVLMKYRYSEEYINFIYSAD